MGLFLERQSPKVAHLKAPKFLRALAGQGAGPDVYFLYELVRIFSKQFHP
jgi:hypothetical protein